ncbi:MAG: hypothetical protein IJ242_15955 [Clostridia bacterium]|nr:hypothetical protein [Clostridia bacterium]
MHNNENALHITVLSSLPGRIRLEFEHSPADPAAFEQIPDIQSCRYTPAIRTLLCRYDPNVTSEWAILRQIAGRYAVQLEPKLIHVKHAEEPGFVMSSSGWAALGAIGLDAVAAATNMGLRSVTRWISTIATLSAVLEHGWEELNTRGSFDPEVMSVVYLLNSLSKGTTLQASAMAWGLTFGRHLLPRDPRETEWSVRRQGNRIMLTPVSLPQTGKFAGSLLRSGLDAMAARH